MRVVVDAGRCAGSGACVRVAPEVFELDGRGGVRVLDPEPAAELGDRVRAAAELCPTGAIAVGG